MDDLQRQKNQIDEVARKAKEDADAQAAQAKQTAANTEADRIIKEAADKAQQIKYDAQK